MEKLLQVSDLCIDLYKDGKTKKLIQQISFDLMPGQTLGIVGESGSGKSLTCFSLLNLLSSKSIKVNRGTAFFRTRDNQVVDLLTDHGKNADALRGSEIAMIFQEPMTSLNPVLTCGKQISEAISDHSLAKNEKKAKILELLDVVRIPDPIRIYNSYPHQISGGQKQRVMIAMALAGYPSLLIADEPTTALDVTVQASVLELIHEIQKKRNMAVVFITHDLGVVKKIADTILVLKNGKVVEYGKTIDVIENSKSEYTKDLIACRKMLQSGKKVRLPSLRDSTFEKEIIPVIPSPEIVERKKVILKVEGLMRRFDSESGFIFKKRESIKAVDDISFELFEGDTLGIVGESGSGKTTLGRTIMRLLRPHAGKVWFDGQEISSFSSKAMYHLRKKIQIIFQDPYTSLNPRQTIEQILKEPLQVHKIGQNDQERIRLISEILEKVEMSTDILSRYPHEFSGGQRQRICIARALVLKPSLIVCDESVSALDVSVQAQVLNLLNDLKKEFRLTYLFISHDLSVVNYMADYIMVLYKGRIEEYGETDSVYRNPNSEYTKNLIKSAPVI